MPASFGTARILDGGPSIPQEVGDWLIWGIGAEATLALCVDGNGPAAWIGVHLAGLAVLIVGQLAVLERPKIQRRMARNKR